MSGKDGLEFHDSGGDEVLFDQGDGQTHTFTNFPASAIDDEEETEDKSQLLKDEGGKRAPSFWTFEYYQQFFDVETSQVFHRVAGSMLPLPKRNFLQIHIRPTPDLYGPFWICTTLVFTTAIAGNLANYLSSAGKDYHWRYDFHKVTFAATAIFSYWWLIPAMMYGFLWWRKSQAGYTFLEILCVYGYSLAIYIPISVSMVILWVINVTWFKWVLVVLGAVLSGGVLLITFWPAVKEETKNVAIIFLGLIFLFHIGLAAGFVLYFFHVPPPVATTTTTTTATPTKAAKLEQKAPANISVQKAGVLPLNNSPGVNGQQAGVLPLNNSPGVDSQQAGGVNVNSETGEKGALADQQAMDNAGGENDLNENINPVQQADVAQAKVANAENVSGGVVNAGVQGNIQTLKQSGDESADESKTRTKLDAGAMGTKLEAKRDIGGRHRKIRSKFLGVEGRKLSKNRNI